MTLEETMAVLCRFSPPYYKLPQQAQQALCQQAPDILRVMRERSKGDAPADAQLLVFWFLFQQSMLMLPRGDKSVAPAATAMCQRINVQLSTIAGDDPAQNDLCAVRWSFTGDLQHLRDLADAAKRPGARGEKAGWMIDLLNRDNPHFRADFLRATTAN